MKNFQNFTIQCFDFFMFLGHFTQVVWKSTTEFGGAAARSSSGGTFVVGRYAPAGNLNTRDAFQENVLPAK